MPDDMTTSISHVTDEGSRRLAPAAPAKPLIEITGGPGGISRAALHELWLFREVLWAFLVRQVKIQYKQAAIGVAWAVLRPVLAAAIFALFLGRLDVLGAEGVPYLLFALAGMVVWTYFSSATTTGSERLVTDQALLRKVYFPREVVPLAAVGSSLVDLVPGFATLAVVAALYGVYPAASWIVLWLPVLIVVLFATAAALAFAALNVYYRDVRYALPFLLQLAFFATPVVYALSLVPERWREPYAVLNPVAGAIDAVREIVLDGDWPDFAVLGLALGWSAALLVAAYWLFKRLERGFADRV